MRVYSVSHSRQYLPTPSDSVHRAFFTINSICSNSIFYARISNRSIRSTTLHILADGLQFSGSVTVLEVVSKFSRSK